MKRCVMLEQGEAAAVVFERAGGDWIGHVFGADHLLPAMEAGTLVADKAFDADKRVPEPLAAAGKTAAVPSKANRRVRRDHDRHLYKERHLIENVFAKPKQFRAIATRSDKTARSFLAGIHLAATATWLD